MDTKLFVGGIPWTSTEESFRTYFSGAGNLVSATVITDRETGRSKGFGFVEYATPEEANKAIEMFNGKDFEGRKLTVNLKRPDEARPPRREFSPRGGMRQAA